jgi:hypothetical protein
VVAYEIKIRRTGVLRVEAQRAHAATGEVQAGWYSPNRPDQSGYQAVKALQRRMPELLDELGLTDRAIIEKHLLPLLTATETKFFPYRRQIERKTKHPRSERQAKEKIEKDLPVKTEQVIDRREVAALGIRLAALDTVFKLKGSYAPKQVDFDPEANVTVEVIDVSAIPRHG